MFWFAVNAHFQINQMFKELQGMDTNSMLYCMYKKQSNCVSNAVVSDFLKQFFISTQSQLGRNKRQLLNRYASKTLDLFYSMSLEQVDLIVNVKLTPDAIKDLTCSKRLLYKRHIQPLSIESSTDSYLVKLMTLMSDPRFLLYFKLSLVVTGILISIGLVIVSFTYPIRSTSLEIEIIVYFYKNVRLQLKKYCHLLQ